MRHLQLPLALALALGAAGAHAMGLGPIEVKSGLNQPLVAEIPILSASPGEIEELEVRLASPEAFARVGLERPVGLTANLQMEVGRNAAGNPVIRVTTPGRFNEPYLTFLLEANWGRGSVVREFSALVDPPYIAKAVIRPMETPTVAVAPPPPPPPVYVPPQAEAEPVPLPTPPDSMVVTDIDPEGPAPIEETPAAEPLPPEPVAAAAEPLPPEPVPESIAAAPEPAPVVPEPMPEPEPMPAPEPVAEPEPTPIAAAPPPPPAPVPEPLPPPPPPPAPAPPAQGATLGPVQDGQTLWSIANNARLESAVTVNQMMLALQRANPEAFIDDNINLLKQGAVLRIPQRDEIVALGEAEAALLVREQATAWNSRRAPVPQPAESIAAAPAAPAPAPSPARPRPPAPASGRLEIVPPSGNEQAARGVQSGASGTGGGTELRAELTREELTAREAEVAELHSQVDQLEAQQTDSQRLIQMQDSKMKALQERLGRQQAKPAGAAPAAAAASAATPAVAVATPWYMNPFVLGGGGIVLVGGLVFALRGRRSSEPVPALSRRISEDDALKATLAGTRPAPEPEVAEAETVPLDETEAQAQRLHQAVEARPDDLEAHICLLRHYYQHSDVAAYESAAQDMRAHVRSTLDPRWREAVVMGVALSPTNALFSQAGWNAPRFGDSGVMPATAPRPGDAPTAATSTPTSDYAPAPSFAGGSVPVPAPVPDPEPTPAPSHYGMPEAGHDEHLQAELHALEADLTGEALPEPDTSAIDLDLESQPDAGDDGSATKIELARAYLDIGDVDGARGMLEEVIAEAGPQGRAEASQLLKEIG